MYYNLFSQLSPFPVKQFVIAPEFTYFSANICPFKTFKSILFSGIQNSFPDELVRRSFYQKYYQILRHGKFPVKERKLFIVGPRDSRKTSWFALFQGEYHIHVNTSKVMLSRKDLFQLLD